MQNLKLLKIEKKFTMADLYYFSKKFSNCEY